MEFTYKSYAELILLLKKCGYETASYNNWKRFRKCAVMRHDIDFDMAKAVRMAEIEKDEGIASTYFVMLTSGFYNVFSKEASDRLHAISRCGHEIGLHFDEMRYPGISADMDSMREKIRMEAGILAEITGSRIKAVSMHRPSRALLDADLQIDGMANSYSREFFYGFRYLSDSRRRWREPVEKIIRSGKFCRLHILTHAFWYCDREEGLAESLAGFLESAASERYRILQMNISDLEGIIEPGGVYALTIHDILNWLDRQNYRYEFDGDRDRQITGFSSLANYKEHTVSWIQKQENYASAGNPADIACAIVQNGVSVRFRNAVRTDASKAVFFAVLEEFWGAGTAGEAAGKGTVVLPGAVIDPSVCIGSNCSVGGSVTIGAGTVIEHSVVIQGKVRIGKNCRIQSGAVIGIDGFGYSFNPETGKKEMAGHFGGVEIGDDVFIGSHVNIARGTIDDTVIGNGVKIAPSTHIGHNSRIGDDATVICSQLYGSTEIGQGSYITASTVRNHVTIGCSSVIGMGSVVTKAVGDHVTAYGIPARPVRMNDGRM